MSAPVIALAGASGDLGFRIARALVDRGADVRVLVRPDVSGDERARLEGVGLKLAEVDVDRQGVLLDAAVKAGVPRFISSDYSADFTKTKPGENRNFDLRREFMARASRAPLKVTSILNGAFMDMLGAQMPIIQKRIHRVLYWHDVNQLLDFTSKDDTAAYVAAAALDETTPRILPIAGDTLSARDISAAMTKVTGKRFRTLRVGSIKTLGTMIRLAQLIAPQPGATFPPWQGMQYMRDQFSGRAKLAPLDNDRYPELRWTSVDQHLTKRFKGSDRDLAENFNHKSRATKDRRS